MRGRWVDIYQSNSKMKKNQAEATYLTFSICFGVMLQSRMRQLVMSRWDDDDDGSKIEMRMR